MKKLFVIFLVFGFVFAMGCSGNNYSTGNVAANPVNGELEIKGSDTMVQLGADLAEAYAKKNGAARISVTGGGSGTGIAALINAETSIANSSREIKQEEIENAQANGVEPTGFVIARDMLSVIVNKGNPVNRLTVDEIGKIYRGEIANWRELGGPGQKITLYGRQSTSGTYEFFREFVVKADYDPTMRNMEGTQAIVDAVRQDKTAIGYVGIGYVLGENREPVEGIKELLVAKDKDGEYMSSLDESKIHVYPISRPLFQYFAGLPKKSSVEHEFLLFELSSEGQDIVEKSGFIRILETDKTNNKELLDKIQ